MPRVIRRRFRVERIAAIAVLLATALTPPAATAMTVPLGSTDGLQAVACPRTTICTAISDTKAVTFNPRSGRLVRHGVRTIYRGPSTLAFLSCPAANECVAADGGAYEVTFNPQTGKRRPLRQVAVMAPNAIACPTVTECTLVDVTGPQTNIGGTELTFDPLTGKPNTAGDVPIDPGNGGLVGVACPTASQCTGIDAFASEVTFNPSTGAAITTGQPFIKALANPAAIACGGTSSCTVVGDAGDQYTFEPRTGRVRGGKHRVSGHSLVALACPAATLCAAISNLGTEVSFNPQTGIRTRGEMKVLPRGDGLTTPYSISCPSVRQCTAAAGRHVVTFNPRTGARLP